MARFIEVEDLSEYFTQDAIHILTENLKQEILEVSDNVIGLGVFLFEDLNTLAHGSINVAFTVSWEMNAEKTKVIQFQPLKCFIYDGNIPDEVLDEMGDVAKLTDNPKWNTNF